MIRNALGAAATSAAVVLFAGQGFAQAPHFTESRTKTVTERPRPELDALGVRLGGFTLFPFVEASGTYDDNIFSTDTGTKDDLIWTIAPGARLQSNWNSHLVELSGRGEIVRYQDFGAEDHENFELAARGRLDVRRDTNVFGGASYRLDHEDRGSPDDANGVEPTEFDVRTLNLGAYNKWNRVSATVEGRVEVRDYDDVRTTTGTVNNDDRDRDVYTVRLRGGYEIQPEYEAFVQVNLTSVDYDVSADDNGFNRDSDGFEARLGARVDLTGLIFGDVYLGYFRREFDDSALSTAKGITGGAALTWNVTTLTTVKGGLERSVTETTITNASSVVRTAADVSVDHELLRNLILSANAGYTQNDYEGVSREDDLARFGVSGNYLLNRYLKFTLEYKYDSRDSSTAGADYDKNTVMLRVRAQL